jgi:hypothetical protein
VKLRDLPFLLAQAFGDKSLSLEHFVAPQDNPHTGVLFVNPTGQPTHVTSLAENVFFDKPLSGPFYDLPWSGISFTDPVTGVYQRWKKFIAVSDSPGKVSHSALFELNVPIGKLKDFLAENGIKWYLLNTVTWEWTSFDDYRKYRQAAKQLVDKNGIT